MPLGIIPFQRIPALRRRYRADGQCTLQHLAGSPAHAQDLRPIFIRRRVVVSRRARPPFCRWSKSRIERVKSRPVIYRIDMSVPDNGFSTIQATISTVVVALSAFFKNMDTDTCQWARASVSKAFAMLLSIPDKIRAYEQRKQEKGRKPTFTEECQESPDILPWILRESEREHAPLSRCALHGDAPRQGVGHALDHRKAEACT